jgi:hypothetical protein
MTDDNPRVRVLEVLSDEDIEALRELDPEIDRDRRDGAGAGAGRGWRELHQQPLPGRK